MTSIKLPSDDRMLEMEEVEGLVRIGNKPRKKDKSFVAPIVKAYKSNKRLRWCTALVVVVALLILLFASDAEEVGSLEEERGKSGMDVENKNVEKKTPPEDILSPETSDVVKVEGHEEESKEFDGEEGEEKKDDTPNEEEKEDEPPKEEEKKEEPAPVEEEKKEEPAQEEEKKTEPPQEEEKKTEPPKEEEKKEEPSAEEKKDEIPSKDDYCAAFPHRDVPLDKFPANAWQKDPAAVKAYLEKAETVVNVAIDAIHQEYGKTLVDGKVDEMWQLDFKNFTAGDPPGPDNPANGGWTTQRSWDGLVRRVLHAMITSDTFTFVMGGHSAAAGHGNHFKQSYSMQFHKVMEPVFDRLGIKLTSRNIANGGLGTSQAAMAAGSLYGDEMDMIVWDSGMTERETNLVDLFMRQSLIGGNRVPALWGGRGGIFQALHENADADVGQFGSGVTGIPQTIDENQVKTLPFAVQYMSCAQERQDLCKQNKYRANCWVERPDVVPPTPQAEKPGSQVSWHPGFRTHQLTGRVLAMTVLQALKEAIQKWKAAGDGKLLPESEWHVADYYENIRSKVISLDPSIGWCYQINGTLPTRMCNTPMKGRTEFTPRANPEQTSLVSLLKPDADGWVPRVEGELLYEGPDVFNPMLNVPEGSVDVVKIINGTRRLLPQRDVAPWQATSSTSADTALGFRHVGDGRILDEAIVVGKGWEITDEGPGRCGGEYNDICGRTADNDCLLNGHHDRRGGLLGNEYSGWLVMEVPAVKEGLVVLKLETWHFPEENQRTKDWTTVNNEPASQRRLRSSINFGTDADIGLIGLQERQLKRQPEPITDDFIFDFAINGKITSWNRDEFMEHRKQVQRVVECVTLLDDPNFSNGKEETVEVAFRMRNCGRHNNFKLTHVYWA